MGWVVVPNLNECRDQLNDRFPKRDKTSDGTIGDASHAASSSSHNPDKTGNPEYRDGDSKNEIRARDVDADLNDPDYDMEDVVQLWVKLARAGVLWWIRYIIYKGRIWHKKDGYKTREYTGKNKHDEHAHVNSDFTQKADEVTGTDWGLKSLKKKPAPAPKPPQPSKPSANEPLVVDGKLGPKTISRWQKIMGTTVDGKIDKKDSQLIRKVQNRLRSTVDHRLVVDGGLGPKTIAALQRYLKSPVDGVISSPKSQVVMALQRRLNTGKF